MDTVFSLSYVEFYLFLSILSGTLPGYNYIAFLKLNFLRKLILGTNDKKILYYLQDLKLTEIFSFFTIVSVRNSKKRIKKYLKKQIVTKS